MFKAFANFISLLFTAGTCLLVFFIILGGIKENSSLLQKFYWLRAGTDGIDNAAPVSQWSLWNVCSYEGSVTDVGDIISCTKNKPAFPLEPTRNFDGDGVPSVFEDHRKKNYYESRFLFPCFTVGLFFEVLLLFTVLFASSNGILSALSQTFNILGFIFITVAAALGTTVVVKSRKYWRDSGSDAVLGKYVLGFAWASVFMTLFNVLLLCCARPGLGGKKKGKHGEDAVSAAAYGAGGYASEPRGAYRFGIGSRKTTEGPTAKETSSADADRSSYIRA